MPGNKAGSNFGDMLDDLKSRLGFGRDDERDDDFDDYNDRDDRERDRDYRDDYSSYGRYGGDDDYDDRGNTRSRVFRAGQDDYADAGVRSGYNAYEDEIKAGGFKPASPYTPRQNRFDRNNIQSSLVSIDDVKAATPLPDRYSYEPAATMPKAAQVRQDAPAAFSGEVGSRYDQPSFEGASSAVGDAAAVSTSIGSGSSYDPYVAYSSAYPSSHTPGRTLTVIKPMAYADVERVARAVKSGDVVVLAMRDTPDDLSKRILDFSFGVASALDANVECPIEKVFAIARGTALSDAEKMRLKGQGVL